MKFIFIIQTEGKGHLTQAISLRQILQDKGHEVLTAWAGISLFRRTPGFLVHPFGKSLRRFPAPNFIPDIKRKGILPVLSILFNLLFFPVYLISVLVLAMNIRFSGADAVVNFYELSGGLAYRLSFSRKKYFVISHHYSFENPDFDWPGGYPLQKKLLLLHNRLCHPAGTTALALSFGDDRKGRYPEGILRVSPLLRKEITSAQTEKMEHVHVYLLNRGLIGQIIHWCREQPGTEVRLFCPVQDMRSVNKPANLIIFPYGDTMFIESLRTSSMVICTAGFETVCEAVYLGKKAFLIPSGRHYEQLCNLADAQNSCAGEAFATNQVLIKEGLSEQAHRNFVEWFGRSERIFLEILTT